MNNDILNQFNPRKILLNTLTMSDYQGDKEAYINKFLQLCQKEILIRLFDTIDEEKQKSVAEELKTKKTYEEMQEVLKKHFNTEKIYSVSSNVSQEFFGEVIKKILPQLAADQKKKLKDYFTSLNQKL